MAFSIVLYMFLSSLSPVAGTGYAVRSGPGRRVSMSAEWNINIGIHHLIVFRRYDASVVGFADIDSLVKISGDDVDYFISEIVFDVVGFHVFFPPVFC